MFGKNTDNISCSACGKQIRKDGKSIYGVGWYVDGDHDDYCSKGCRWEGFDRKQKEKHGHPHRS